MVSDAAVGPQAAIQAVSPSWCHMPVTIGPHTPFHAHSQEYGEIRSLYTACKPQGYVVLTFYDLRAAFLAVHALRGSRLREHPLTVRFSTSKDNMADKAVHQGELAGWAAQWLVETQLCRLCVGVAPVAVAVGPSQVLMMAQGDVEHQSTAKFMKMTALSFVCRGSWRNPPACAARYGSRSP